MIFRISGSMLSYYSPIYNINLDDKAIACVRDCYPLDKETDSRLGYPSGMGYFNAGVAVYNLDYWRENHIGDKLFGYIRENFAKLKYMDQDVVNAVLYDKKVFADERYNYQVLFLASSFWEDYSDGFHQKLIEEGRNVVVAHFCGPVKVWDFRYYGGPFYDIWEKYRRISLWRREGHVTSPRMKYIKFLIKRHVLPRFIKKQMKEQWVSLV